MHEIHDVSVDARTVSHAPATADAVRHMTGVRSSEGTAATAPLPAKCDARAMLQHPHPALARDPTTEGWLRELAAQALDAPPNTVAPPRHATPRITRPTQETLFAGAAPEALSCPTAILVHTERQREDTTASVRADLVHLISEPGRPIPAQLSRRDRAAVHHLRASYLAAFADQAVRATLKTPEDVYQVMRPIVATRETEALYVLPLDSHCRLTTEPIQVTTGDIDGTDASPRIVMRNALAAKATQMIVVHNHPGNNPTPSPADRAVTRRLCEGGRSIDIPLRDHVIVTRSGFTSLFREDPSLFR